MLHISDHHRIYIYYMFVMDIHIITYLLHNHCQSNHAWSIGQRRSLYAKRWTWVIGVNQFSQSANAKELTNKYVSSKTGIYNLLVTAEKRMYVWLKGTPDSIENNNMWHESCVRWWELMRPPSWSWDFSRRCSFVIPDSEAFSHCSWAPALLHLPGVPWWCARTARKTPDPTPWSIDYNRDIHGFSWVYLSLVNCHLLWTSAPVWMSSESNPMELLHRLHLHMDHIAFYDVCVCVMSTRLMHGCQKLNTSGLLLILQEDMNTHPH